MTPLKTILVVAGLFGACSKHEAKPRDTTRAESTAAVTITPRTASPFPTVGIAVGDSAWAWCAEFPPDSASRPPGVGDTVAIVFGTAEDPAALYARIAAPRSAQCQAAFPQPRWDGYLAYDLTLTTSPPTGVDISSVALAIVSPARWTRRGDGRVEADLDGDGVPEEVRRCTADEGEHFTIWSVNPTAVGGTPSRRAHEYYDWGAFTDPRCKPGDDGRDV